MIRCISVLIAFFLPVTAFCGESYTLLWKQSFDSKVIKPSAVMAFTSRDSAFPLQSIITEKSLIVLNQKGQIKENISFTPYDLIKVSDNGDTLVGVKKNKIFVFNAKKQISSFKINQTILLSEHLTLEIAPDGSFIVLLSWFHKTIWFYSQKGELLSSHSVDDLKGASIKISKNSQRIVLHIPNYGDGTSNGYLLCFQFNGQFLWRYDHPGCKAEFDLSRNGEWIILMANQMIYSLKNNKLIYQKKMDSSKAEVAISNDGQHVALARQSDHHVIYIDNQTGQELWKQKISGFDRKASLFTDIEVNPNRIAVAICRHWSRRNQESWGIVFNTEGKRIWDVEFNHKAMDFLFSEDGSVIGGWGDNMVYLFRFVYEHSANKD